MRTTLRLVPLLQRGQLRRDCFTSLLAVAAFALATGFALAVLGGVHAFVQRLARPPAGLSAMEAENYFTFAVIAACLLVVPIGALAGAAARLGLARRDQRLAALRLLGATPGQVAQLTVLETMMQAAIGAIAGLGVYALTLPIWLSLTFQSKRLTVEEMWPGHLVVLLTMAGVVLVAGVSAIATMRRVVVTPLGVAARHSSKGLSALRLLTLMVALIAFAVVSRGSGPSTILLVLAAFVAVFAAFNMVGAWLVWLLGRVMAVRARKPGTLLAARRLLDDPKGSWRVVGGPALACFVATVLSTVQSLSATGDGGAARTLLTDLGTGAWVTVGIAFATAACSAGITQVAAVADRRREYVLAHLAGVGEETLNQGRRRQLVFSLALTAGGACLTAIAAMAPLGVLQLLATGTALTFMVGGVLAGMAAVVLAGEAARPALHSILLHPEPRPD